MPSLKDFYRVAIALAEATVLQLCGIIYLSQVVNIAVLFEYVCCVNCTCSQSTGGLLKRP